MKLNIVGLIVINLLLASCQNKIKKEINDESVNIDKEISFYTTDSIKIFGDLYEVDKTATTVLLFHQGGSNARGEYGLIVPKLIEKNFNVLTIDQRMGGQAYGNYNRTLANIPSNNFGDGYGYCDAYNNLEGALRFILSSGFTGNKIIWGSSYSASLAIQLANQNQDKINAVLAFSPASGGSMKDCLPNPYFETLKIPLLLLRPPNEMENENAKSQFELARLNGHQTYIAKYGVHGSSMLVKERVGNDVDETWKVVNTFLEENR